MTMNRTRYVLAVVAVALMAAGCRGTTTPTAKPSSTSPTTTSSVSPTATGVAGAQLWIQLYGAGQRPAAAQSVVVSPDGATVFVTGSSGTAAYHAATGARLWLTSSSAFARTGGSTPPPTAAVSPDGAKVFVTGTTSGRPAAGAAGPGEDYATFAYNAATGAQLWAKRYNGPGKGADGARSVAVSPSGGTVFVHGISEGTVSGPDYATVAYNASTGAQVWVARYNGPGNGAEMFFPTDAPQSLAVSRDGARVFVTGMSEGTASGADYATVAYKALTGARLWVSRYNGPANGADGARAVAVNRGGDTVFVTGGSEGTASGSDFATVGYNAATGAQVWVKRYDGPAKHNEGAGSIAVDSSGATVFVTGTSEGPTQGKEDYATVGYRAATGAQLWVTRYDGPAHGDDNAASLALSPTGAKVYVTGWTSRGEGAGQAYATVAYDSTSGAQSWATLYNGPAKGYNEARSLAVSPSTGTVFVTGSADNTYATIAYHG